MPNERYKLQVFMEVYQKWVTICIANDNLAVDEFYGQHSKLYPEKQFRIVLPTL